MYSVVLMVLTLVGLLIKCILRYLLIVLLFYVTIDSKRRLILHKFQFMSLLKESQVISFHSMYASFT